VEFVLYVREKFGRRISELASPCLNFLENCFGSPWGEFCIFCLLAESLVRCHVVLMRKRLGIIFGLLLVAILPSCVPDTPESRIGERPQDYARLSAKHKELVSRGEIAKGMSKEAVAIAWGSPATRALGLRNGRNMERWDYRGQQPVVTHQFYGGYSRGCYGPYRYRGYGAGFGPQINYVPYRRASVWFVNDRVDEWERME
jgi:hypothetical protein